MTGIVKGMRKLGGGSVLKESISTFSSMEGKDKKGDTVVYGKYAGSEVEIKNTTHLIVRESELLGVIEG